jgi:spermidine/putrescine transport system permease protein
VSGTSRARDTLLWAAAGAALLFLFLPIFVVAAFSFNDNQGRFNVVWNGFTLRHWQDPFAVEGLAEALRNSLLIAGTTTLLATTLGTLMAIALARHRFRGRGPSEVLALLPLATPEVVLGAALLGLFLVGGLARGFATIVIAHVMFTIGYVVVTVRARLEGMDLRVEEAAMDLGANEWTTLRKVTLPLILPGVISAGLLSFAISLDDFVITNFNAGQTQTFPLFVFGAARQGVPPQVNVLATGLMVLVGVLMVLNVLAQRRAARRPTGAA